MQSNLGSKALLAKKKIKGKSEKCYFSQTHFSVLDLNPSECYRTLIGNQYLHFIPSVLINGLHFIPCPETQI